MLITRALFILLFYDLFVRPRGFHHIHTIVRRWSTSDKAANQHAIDDVSSAVNYACIFYPKHVLCLQRAFLTTYLLRSRGVAAQMVLGAQKLPFRAHAWVEVAGQPVNEKSTVNAIYSVWERC